MIISPKYKLIFVTTPKSGSHTGFKLMQTYFDANKTEFNHNRSIPAKYKNYDTFTFVRNPYERFCALYFACVINDKKRFVPIHARKSIEEYAEWYVSMKRMGRYIREDLTSPQTYWHRNTKIKNFIQIEEAQELFNIMYPELNIRMPHELKRTHATWEDVATDELSNLVSEWADNDFNHYGYYNENNYSTPPRLD